MITLNVHIRVKPGGREELIGAGRVLFDELAKEPTFQTIVSYGLN